MIAPDTLYVVEAIGAAGTERFHNVHEDMVKACDEAEVLAKAGAQVQVCAYDRGVSIFRSANWGKS